MPSQSWVLTDAAQNLHLEPFAISEKDGTRLEGATNWAIRRTTLRGGVSTGVDVVEIDNGRLKVSILPTRGMGLWRGECDGLPLGWQSPVARPVNPAFVNVMDRGGLGWLAGFNEWLCRCGLDSNGPPGEDVVPNNEGHPTRTELTLHGRIANIPAHYVEAAVSTEGRGTLSVTGIVDECMLFGPGLRLKSTVRTDAGSNRLTIIDEVINLRGVASEFELLYHANMGRPFLEPEAQIVAPVMEVAPRDGRAAESIGQYNVYGPPTAGYVEQVFWMNLAAAPDGRTLVLLRNAHGDKGVSLRFNKRELPCFTVWKNTQAEADGYVTGLEPATNYPNSKTFERKQGRVPVLPPGGSYKTSLELSVHATARDVTAAEQEIAAIQKLHPPQVHTQPQARYSRLDG